MPLVRDAPCCVPFPIFLPIGGAFVPVNSEEVGEITHMASLMFAEALTPSLALPDRPSGSRIGTFPGCMRFGELPTPINLVAGLLRLIAMVAEEVFNK